MAKKDFYIPICVDNLAQFFAFGFITPASVFPFKNYWFDELSLHSNVIPLYDKPTAKLKIPFTGVQMSKTEDKYAKSAVVVISVDDTDLQRSSCSTFRYLHGLLPTYLINNIVFEDKEALEHFKGLTYKTGRVSEDLLNRVKLKATGFKALFEKPNQDPLNFEKDESNLDESSEFSPLDDKVLRKMSGYGAVVALSYVMAKNSSHANEAHKELLSIENKNDDSLLSIKLLRSYLLKDTEEEASKKKIQDDFFDALIGCNDQEMILDRLIPFFDMNAEDSGAVEFLQDLKGRVHDIRKGKNTSTKSEQMSKFSSVERVSHFIDQTVTMFSLLDETEKLFTQPIVTVNDEGYLNIAVAYGLRDKFYDLPRSVRQITGLETLVIASMYSFYQSTTGNKTQDNSVKLDAIPTFIDILSDSDTPQLRVALSNKFSLVLQDDRISVNIDKHSYVPEYPEAFIKVFSSETTEFSERMISQKAFEDIDFNNILSLYEEEKSLVKQRKKFASQLKKL
ncbi:hypothetical protein [Vibrio ezurae]|uniref:Uncharacterized protein n=1 Tax=Vibrio ezurae NBRC 102218 TaxID=1219080 RepID=U3B2S1_9VIBR|nr:hypothetical protein [Vibrio ezurae]GAD79752.1 hypothetical protein VEZ01S_20_00240 [Vibrio ezurae NBRC 102218]